jgi:DNA repair exonuclease SbcCD nuclease subunit
MAQNEVLLFSDIHIHCHKRKNERLEDCLKALNWVFDVAEERKIKDILFGGDLFHDRHKIDIFTYQRAFETLEKRLKGGHFNLYLLLGNHDLWYNEKTTVSSVIPLSSLPGVRIISEPERLEINGSFWDFIPFTHNPIDTLEQLKKKKGDPEYALGHISVDGAVLHGSSTSDVAIEHDGDMVTITPSLFDHYKHTFLGHYHAEQRVNEKVEYIGSPLELSFGEAFTEKHIIAFDGRTGKKTYIKNEFSPKHLVISMDERNKYNLEGNFVKIKVEDIGATDLVAMRKEILDGTNLGSLEIKQQKRKLEEHMINDAKAILFKGEEMLSRYLDEVGTNSLDRDILLKIGQKICQQTASKDE